DVADSLHVPLNEYSSKQKQSLLWLASSSASSTSLILIFYFYLYFYFYFYFFFFYEATSHFQNLLTIQMLVWEEDDSETSTKRGRCEVPDKQIFLAC
ncbi:hypothetical protein Tco_1544172, partial [Tanacetum coccineum]